ncbi:hypothetical protein BFJ69_g16724 [Fusarium oxysporum]|uniref:Uncharacterized protein n=1 Tax=Fusarium oxysporum TaxID=5507 RepID=A0A420MAB6_FUSOX|nr:hypothetical protein BFJ69_g16724 [Fusarium oxysporum]
MRIYDYERCMPATGSPRYNSHGYHVASIYGSNSDTYERGTGIRFATNCQLFNNGGGQCMDQNVNLHDAAFTSNNKSISKKQIPSICNSFQQLPYNSFGDNNHRFAAIHRTQIQNIRAVGSYLSRHLSLSHTPKATDADACKHRIPSGYSLKHWEPSEEPILLLGSVFDANNLGKWIYDWTTYCHGPSAPISDMAGDMWLLLIQLADKVKRAKETVGHIYSAADRDRVEKFIEAGCCLTEKLRSLLKICEVSMLKVAKRNQAGLGENAGVEFVETLFGRDRKLDMTEKFMHSVRHFNLHFDNHCEGILQKPVG